MSHLVDHWATRFLDASDTPQSLPRPSATGVAGGLDEAYLIQQATLDLRCHRGERLHAIKLGLVDPAEQLQWNIPHPTWGSLTDSMLLEPGQAFSLSRGLAPRLEAEIVVVLGDTLTTVPGTLEEFLPSIASVHAGIEILDSRFDGGSFQPVDAVADNQSALSGVWLEPGVSPDWATLAEEDVHVMFNADIASVSRDPGARPHPLESVYRAVSDRLERGCEVSKGLAVFSGNLLPEPVGLAESDRIQVTFSTLGTLTLDVVA